jgi:hypothetical protein
VRPASGDHFSQTISELPAHYVSGRSLHRIVTGAVIRGTQRVHGVALVTLQGRDLLARQVCGQSSGTITIQRGSRVDLRLIIN